MAARPLVVASLVLTTVLAVACGRHRPYFGWASVPACQGAIRSRALSEFGTNARIDFDAPADERRIEKGRVRVTGTAILRRKKRENLALAYECVTSPKHSRIVSAKYSARR